MGIDISRYFICFLCVGVNHEGQLANLLFLSASSYSHEQCAIDFIAITQDISDSWAPPNHAALRGDSVSAPQGQQGRSRFMDI